MIHIQRLSDCAPLTDNSELYREVAAYLLYCHMELLEYEDEEDVDEHDFNFQILNEEDLPMLNDLLRDLGPPEEIVQININADGMVQTIYRLVYVSQVLFIPTDISDQFSF